MGEQRRADRQDPAGDGGQGNREQSDSLPLTQVAPAVAISGRVRRVLHAGNPREPDYREAQKAVHEVRSELARLRRRLEQMQRIETDFAHDSQALRASGAVHCAIVALSALEFGESSFAAKAERSRFIWEDAAANPDRYAIEEGSHGYGRPDWNWRDWNWDPAKSTP